MYEKTEFFSNFEAVSVYLFYDFCSEHAEAEQFTVAEGCRRRHNNGFAPLLCES